MKLIYLISAFILSLGSRPISQVPPSAFAIANLSPFQRGFGSLQIMAVHQKVPNGDNNDFALTGLRRDNWTAMVPGIFKEEPPSKITTNKFQWRPQLGGQREPCKISSSWLLSHFDFGKDFLFLTY